MSTTPKAIQEEAIKRYGCPPNVSGDWTPCYREQQAFIAGYQLATDGREELENRNEYLVRNLHATEDQNFRIKTIIEQLQSSLKEKDQEIEKGNQAIKENCLLRQEIERLKQYEPQKGCVDVAMYYEDDSEEEDNFQPCDYCDIPDACSDFGCAIKAGIKRDYTG